MSAAAPITDPPERWPRPSDLPAWTVPLVLLPCQVFGTYGAALGQAALRPLDAFGHGPPAWVLMVPAAAELVRTRAERDAETRRIAQEQRRRVAGEERLRIARELHDVPAHNISMINVRAGVALHLLDSATEEFVRYYASVVGNGHTFSADCEIAGTRFKEGERLWVSWSTANRDPAVFPDPDEIDLAREDNRHAGFGLGVHRCIGSNVARTVFKRMLVQVLDRMPDYVCEPEGAVHYETIGVINGMRFLPATFTPSPRLGAGLEETLERLQKVCDGQRLAEPVTARRSKAKI